MARDYAREYASNKKGTELTNNINLSFQNKNYSMNSNILEAEKELQAIIERERKEGRVTVRDFMIGDKEFKLVEETV